ncbi:MAG TPA: NADH-ubiquinone oxidoreductase-F iron-sulfur binding region domain-containing protein [Candidatus Pacearchaeota archaeon]|nr:NADH-ubiquinone oxidoreductase-F iron-sulfur binding region domain-containing protein [Candidatus Pacearchaeota archaeon]
MEIIEKLKQANLRGRGGAGFPAWQKWQMVKDAPGETKYVVCNVSEGEPAVAKDGHILEKWPDIVVEGIELAMNEAGAKKGYLYLRRDYFDKFKNALAEIIGARAIEIIREPGGYLGGEETALLDSIEGKPCEPRIKPPFPPQAGLWGRPTLINNLETLYFAARIVRGEYKNTRFYTIAGDCAGPGVFERGDGLTIKEILEKTGNLPGGEFFVQAGGGASGTIMMSDELEVPLSGAGSIVIYDKAKTDPRRLGLKWINFFIAENCGKCVPCREGVLRLREIFSKEPLDIARAQGIVKLLAAASFCPFGKGVANSFGSLIAKLMEKS